MTENPSGLRDDRPRVEELRQELDRARSAIAKLEARCDRLGYRLEVAEWKLAATKQRRWWRLGELIGRLRQRPTELLDVLGELLRLLRVRPSRPPRPEQPEPHRVAELETGEHGPSHVVEPRRAIVAVGVMSERTEELLRHEWPLRRLRQDTWEETIAEIRPQLVLLESSESRAWEPSSLAAVRLMAEQLDAMLLEVDLWGAGATVHPRLHNPITTSRRGSGYTTVDPARRLVDGTTHADEVSFVAALRRKRVAVVDGSNSAADLARIAATSTALVVRGDGHGYGISVENDESCDAAVATFSRSSALAARSAHAGMRQAYRRHDVGALLGSPEDLVPPVDVMVATMRPHRLENLLDNIGRQTYPNLRLFLIAHGIALDETRVRDLAAQRGIRLAGLWTEPEDVILGEVFNRGFARTGAQLVAKMDDDDFYGAEYLWDLVTAKDASGAEVAGKWAHYAYLEGPGTTIYRFGGNEHRFRDIVAISTLLMDRSVFDEDRFPPMPYGSGSVFLRSLGAAGARVFAADRWNYLYVRGAEGARNTFPESDLTMLARSDVVCTGFLLDEVVV